MKDRPWGFQKIEVLPSGLRECVLRVDYMPISEARSLACSQRETLLHQVARWRLGTPEQFKILFRIVKDQPPLKRSL